MDILDGLGMTEMVHIFLSSRVGQVRPGSTAWPFPATTSRSSTMTGSRYPRARPAPCSVRGASAATGYWSRYDASRLVFQGEWLRTGDTYVLDADGYYTCLGRTGDMLKASGMWVAPAEVEARLHAHQAVSDAAVVAAMDTDGLEKPVAFVILRPGQVATETELIQFCREGLPSFKRPRRSCSSASIRPPVLAKSAGLTCGRWLTTPACLDETARPMPHDKKNARGGDLLAATGDLAAMDPDIQPGRDGRH